MRSFLFIIDIIIKEATVIYKALYRKWRPLSFDDVISQPHITTTLKNQIKNNRTAHAYLFTGSRGTGKTTCARIFAKAVNCPNRSDGNPCLECNVCHDADDAALSDIIEIDAASNNGVDDIRDLRDSAAYTPERCRYKVYIIDEVHMLTPNAFNALLKIMEEPPEYVKFILATTEIHKVPATISSRCQRFDFMRILSEDISKRLLYIAEHENIRLEENAASLIAKLADGGMRDAISILDQCAAYSDTIDMNIVSAAAGIADRSHIFEIINASVQKQPKIALSVADRLYGMSKDMQKLCVELTEQFRNIMLLKVCPQKSELLTCLPDETERLKDFSDKLELNEILSGLSILQECNEKIGKALNKRVELEMCLIKLCTKQFHQKLDNPVIYDKIKQSNDAPLRSSPQPPNREVRQEERADVAAESSKLNTSDFKPLAEWSSILEEFTKICPSVSGTLAGSRAYAYKNILLIDTKNKFFLRLFKIKENAHMLDKAIQTVMGKKFAIRARCQNTDKDDPGAEALIEKAINSGIETAVE